MVLLYLTVASVWPVFLEKFISVNYRDYSSEKKKAVLLRNSLKVKLSVSLQLEVASASLQFKHSQRYFGLSRVGW